MRRGSIRRRAAALALTGAAFALAAAGCGTTSGGSSSSNASTSGASGKGPLKVAFIYNGPINDQGWDTAMDQGRQAVQRKFGDKVSVTYKVVPDGPPVNQVLQSLIQDGYKLIFTTSFGDQKYSIPLAKQHPDVKFVQAESATTLPNLATYFTPDSDGFYIAGMAAASLSKNGRVGMVGGFPIPDNIAETNGFALGAKKVKPNAQVRLVWTNDWNSVSKAQDGAQGLINSGAGGLAFLTTGPAPAQVAQRNNVPWIGYQVDQKGAAPKQFLLGVRWNLAPYFTDQVSKVLDGSWKTNTYFGTIENGAVVIDKGGAMYDKVPSDVRAKIDKAIQEFKAGTLSQFTGPIRDQKGKLRVPAGKSLKPEEMGGMDYLVQNVKGTGSSGS